MVHESFITGQDHQQNWPLHDRSAEWPEMSVWTNKHHHLKKISMFLHERHLPPGTIQDTWARQTKDKNTLIPRFRWHASTKASSFSYYGQFWPKWTWYQTDRPVASKRSIYIRKSCLPKWRTTSCYLTKSPTHLSPKGVSPSVITLSTTRKTPPPVKPCSCCYEWLWRNIYEG